MNPSVARHDTPDRGDKHRFLFHAEDSLLLVTGIQERICAAAEPEYRETCLKNSYILTRSAMSLHLPIIVSEQLPERMGKTIETFDSLLTDQPRIEKLMFSCWREGEIRAAIKGQSCKTVIIAGLEAHVCILQTVMDLLCNGYHPVVAMDAVCSRSAYHRQAALEAMAQAGAVLYPTESIVFMLMNTADTPLFDSTLDLLGWDIPPYTYPPKVA